MRIMAPDIGGRFGAGGICGTAEGLGGKGGRAMAELSLSWSELGLKGGAPRPLPAAGAGAEPGGVVDGGAEAGGLVEAAGGRARPASRRSSSGFVLRRLNTISPVPALAKAAGVTRTSRD
ncbi:hypothetical protein AcidC75_30020 [Acidisoma sp. C75]